MRWNSWWNEVICWWKVCYGWYFLMKSGIFIAKLKKWVIFGVYLWWKEVFCLINQWNGRKFKNFLGIIHQNGKIIDKMGWDWSWWGGPMGYYMHLRVKFGAIWGLIVHDTPVGGWARGLLYAKVGEIWENSIIWPWGGTPPQGYYMQFRVNFGRNIIWHTCGWVGPRVIICKVWWNFEQKWVNSSIPPWAQGLLYAKLGGFWQKSG